MKRILAGPVLMLACAGALAEDAGLLRCRAIKDSPQRLACYDALPLGAPSSSAAAAAPGSAAAATTQSVTQSLLARFGFEQRVQPDELPSVQSHIAGRFEGWGPSANIKLANGQVWQVTDGSTKFAWVDNPKVTVTRGALGSFFLDIEGVKPAPRVRRVQ